MWAITSWRGPPFLRAPPSKQIPFPPRPGALLTVMADVGHHVVAELLFQSSHPIEVDLVAPPAQRLDLLPRDGETQLRLAFGEGDPEVAPGPITAVPREVLDHFAAGVTVDERVLINWRAPLAHTAIFRAASSECQARRKPIIRSW